MIPPRPWQLSVPQPPWGNDRVYVVDADGHQVIGSALDRDLAELLIRLVNAERLA